MQLSKHLVLFQYILHQFGYERFERLRDEFAAKQTGYDATGRSYFANSLLGTVRHLDDRTLLHYDEAIRTYETRLRTHRAEPLLTFKYYQYFALLFTEYYLDQLSTNARRLLDGLNAFKNAHDDFAAIGDYTQKDLKKLAYWMATGSGKTLLMHCNYWQITKYFKDWENIILITPNEGLSHQHYDELRASGIAAHLYAGSEESLKTRPGEILIIEITKLVKDKEGGGVTVDVDYFAESRNLVLIDEGHKGQRSEEKAWKGLREHITRADTSFTFEYSATFGQIITNSTPDLLNEYGKSIGFDYSYRHFYTDGYGKDFTVFNIEADNEYSADQTRLLMTAGLLGFYEQTVLFEQYRAELATYKIEKPLWIFIGSKVQGDKNQSDVSQVVLFFQDILARPQALQQDMDRILDNRANLVNSDGDDIFAQRFLHLRQQRPAAADVLNRIFHGAGQIEALQIKQGDGEIGLRTRTGAGYFAVINIGDAPKYAKKLEEETNKEIAAQDDNFTPSLFRALSDPASTINILIGSKKFIEGWNSWRVASMGLMNMGKSEGAQIIQLFGRGVRLKGRDSSLKREGPQAAYHIRALQTISIFGLNASYMSHFLSNIEKETPDYREYTIDIRFNQPEKWENKIITFGKADKQTFKETPVFLESKDTILTRVSVDLRSKVSVASSGFNNQVAEEDFEYNQNFLKEFYGFIDFPALLLECNRYKLVRGYNNLLITAEMLHDIVLSGKYELLSSQGQFGLAEAMTGQLQEVAGYVVKDYINKFYADKEKEYLTRNLTLERLTTTHDAFPADYKMIVKVPKAQADTVAALLSDLQKFYNQNVPEIPTLHFANHLYSPVAAWKKGKKFQDIKTVPVKLNEGETCFVEHLSQFVISVADRLAGKEVYLLRNLSQRGIGFFIESSSFYPDFILWVVESHRQTIFFLDPKGIRFKGNFKDDKILFCAQTIREISADLRKKAAQEKYGIDVELDAYILSVSKFDELKASWGTGNVTREDFTQNHVLFIEDDKAYLNHLFQKFLS